MIDLLPDREAKKVAEWFKAHPTVEIVTRDRSKTYAAGVAEGAPQAIQVADRWHLASNLVDALETTLAKHPSRLRGAPLQDESVSTEKQKPAKTEDHPTLQADQLAISDAKRTLRKQQYDQVIALRQQGVFAADIAKHVGLGKRTVHRWLAHGSFPERKKRATQPTKIDPYRPYIHQR